MTIQNFTNIAQMQYFFQQIFLHKTPLEGSHKGRDIPSRVIDDINA